MMCALSAKWRNSRKVDMCINEGEIQNTNAINHSSCKYAPREYFLSASKDAAVLHHKVNCKFAVVVIILFIEFYRFIDASS